MGLLRLIKSSAKSSFYPIRGRPYGPREPNAKSSFTPGVKSYVRRVERLEGPSRKAVATAGIEDILDYLAEGLLSAPPVRDLVGNISCHTVSRLCELDAWQLDDDDQAPNTTSRNAAHCRGEIGRD